MWQETKPLGHGIWEIGALLDPEYRGRGHGTNAQTLLAEYLFATTTAHRLWAGTESDNGWREVADAALKFVERFE